MSSNNWNPFESVRVLSPKDLNELAKVKIDPSFSILLNLRSGDALFQQGVTYSKEGDLTKSYFYFMKVANLIIREIPKHPDYKSVPKSILKQAKKQGIYALEQLEIIHPILEQRYNEYIDNLNQWKKNNKLKFIKEDKQQQDNKNNKYDPKWNVGDALPNLNITHNNNSNNYDPNWNVGDALPQIQPNKIEEYKKQEYTNPYSIIRQLLNQNETNTINDYYNVNPISAIYDLLPSPPPLPPKPFDNFNLNDNNNNNELNNIPQVNELRKIILSTNLITEFMSIASTNTNKNIETCGILAGILKQETFYFNHLIIPSQIGTSDQCTMINEEQLFNVIYEKQLIILGWIHTHPTQTCFLSSVDLHTHLGFQLILPEAIAIVVAPKFNPNFGTFNLTVPIGLNEIKKCKEKNLFHPHKLNNDQLFNDTNVEITSKGHVIYNHLDFTSLDLRDK